MTTKVSSHPLLTPTEHKKKLKTFLVIKDKEISTLKDDIYKAQGIVDKKTQLVELKDDQIRILKLEKTEAIREKLKAEGKLDGKNTKIDDLKTELAKIKKDLSKSIDAESKVLLQNKDDEVEKLKKYIFAAYHLLKSAIDCMFYKRKTTPAVTLNIETWFLNVEKKLK